MTNSLLQNAEFISFQKTDSPGWTIFQQRKFGTVDFFRDWADYKHGFGSLDGDFWWGLEHLYQVS